MQDSADPTRFFGGGAMSLTLDAQGTAATVSDPGGIEHPHRAIVFGASGLPHRALPLADNAVCRQIEEESLALPGCLFALHAPTAGDQRMVEPTRGWGLAGLQFEGGENSVRRIEVGCQRWLSSWRRFHIHWARICQTS